MIFLIVLFELVENEDDFKSVFEIVFWYFIYCFLNLLKLLLYKSFFKFL